MDDSKATNPHAALAALRSFDPVVWIAGGLAKGAEFDELVREVHDRLRGVVLLGADRGRIADALARHAPDVPVIEGPAKDHGAMTRIVKAAAALSRPRDTVLLAPACASQDMFANYASVVTCSPRRLANARPEHNDRLAGGPRGRHDGDQGPTNAVRRLGSSVLRSSAASTTRSRRTTWY